MMKTYKLHSGYSLIEIMVAMLIGLFLIGGIMQLFIASKKTYQMEDAMAHVQENQRFALDFMVHDVRSAGSWGCFKDSTLIQNLLNTTGTGVYATATQGLTGTNNQDYAAPSGSPAYVTGTDTLSLKGASALLDANGVEVALTTQTPALAAPIVTSSSNIKVNDILFMGDCEGGNIFQVINISGNTIEHGIAASSFPLPGNSTDKFSKNFGTDARLYAFNAVTYSIRTSDESGRPALFRQTANDSPVELVEGVEDMQILYGEDTDDNGTPNRYVTADQVTSMGNVLSLQVSLVVQSVDDNQVSSPIAFTATTGKTYNNGANPDRRMRRSTTSVISIRNRLY
jgi:type IV pilus assembly protein PilW